MTTQEQEPKEPVLTGLAVALVTFFDEHGHVDHATTARHAAHLVERGVTGIVVAGTTGEASHLSMKERLDLLDAVRRTVPAPFPVILGTGNLAAGVSCTDLTKRSIDHGASGALVLSPHHGDIRSFYEEIVAAVGSFPVLGYHWPAASPPGIDLALLPHLPVAGLKDSTGDPERLIATIELFNKPVYTGNSMILTMAGQLGLAGAILAVANLEPELAAAAFAGDMDAQRRLLEAHRAVYTNFPGGLKAELNRRFGTPVYHRNNH